ncbi:MAG: LysR family transcriptional regulator [Geminicoccaceae bacterium]
MRITLNQIEAFYWVMRHGSFYAAASHLNLTQPTISVRIHGLEKALGVQLFQKVGRRSLPTLEAEAILPQAEQMLAMVDDFVIKPTRADPLRGRLRLGAPDSFGLICLPELLGALKSRFPHLQTAVTIDRAPALCHALNTRDLDIAFLTEPELGPHIGIEPIGPASFTWVAGPGVSLPDRTITPEDLVETDVFTFPAPSNLMKIVVNWFHSRSVRPRNIRTCNDLSVILLLLANGAGVSLLPTGILTNDNSKPGFRLLRTEPVIESPHYVAAFQKDKKGAALSAVIEMTKPIMLRRRLIAPPPEAP